MKDRPEPLAFLDDDLDFYNHDHYHYRQEVKMSVAHLFLQVEAGGEIPPAFPFLTGKYEGMVYGVIVCAS
jgi:hypothetical protein